MTKPTRKEAIEQQCKQCMGHWADGKQDCENLQCPLYTYMPYAKKEADLELFRYSAKHVGMQLKEDTKREMTEEQKEAMVKRMKKIHKKGNNNEEE